MTTIPPGPLGDDWLSSLFGGSLASDTAPLDGLHVSRAGDFYWPTEAGVERLPLTAPPLTAAEIRARVATDEIRKVA